jgi:hypothetical protein
MRLLAGTTEGPRRVRQLDGAILFGYERFVANPDITLVPGSFRVDGDTTGTRKAIRPWFVDGIGDWHQE